MSYHEGGHFVAARGAGLQPLGCEVGESGGVTHLCPEDRAPRTPEGRRRLLECLFGGELAERFRFGLLPMERGLAKDHAVIDRLLSEWPTHAERVHEQKRAIDAAAASLRDRWELVEAIAAELVEFGRWGTSSTGRVPCRARGGPVLRRLPSAVHASRLELGGGLGLLGSSAEPQPNHRGGRS